ncbi:pppGpp 5'-phosphohydrolase and exopolyphosphatase, putative [Geotalea daltonii FRC-32]|uniref:PppGpp 5'-phosphohydrolase and exopolyphosphatase, putative n=1 Tax=Geotalea daltonii (strain DSM 22248 / JCM 15807 / FRC-32) TaxID=316067 RepID=B9M224_GEODF|nr:exopolyphosphatase [Geotalea daltonii]ACM21142.1 pppGpp 5'-phosphohydrolase and exopolyphosphatase, putative [Geotalea daltonii FRC-32]
MTELKASIDLGTNTARLLIGFKEDEHTIRQVLLKRQITRLGGGFTRESGISPEAEARSLAAMQEFAGEILRHNVGKIRAVATSAVRDATNGAEFCRKVFDETGIQLQVISGEQEALFTLRGVLAGLDNKKGKFLVFDVGGGSTEYTLAEDSLPVFTRSLPLGVVRLTEGKSGPEAMTEKIRRELAALGGEMNRSAVDLGGTILVGTAGTATTLAAIHMEMTDYDYRLVNNHTMALADIEKIHARLLPLSPEERLKVKGLEKGREDLIVAGTLITINTMKHFGFNSLKISDFGQLEGLLLED